LIRAREEFLAYVSPQYRENLRPMISLKQSNLRSSKKQSPNSSGELMPFTLVDDLASRSIAAAENTSPEDFSWLDSVQAVRQPWDGVRFLCMRGTSRLWACDGEYVACRPKDFHEATRNRHARFLESGHYKHVGTFDDVQVFELLPGSPFRRDNRTLIPGVNLYRDMRECSVAAVRRDWVLYHDILEAIASNIKAKFDSNNAKLVFEDILNQIEQSIRLRGGPSQAEVDAGISNVRRKRGLGQGRVIALPS
jgi:hypothetical protein